MARRKTIHLYSDETISIDLEKISIGLTAISKHLIWKVGKERFSIIGEQIQFPISYDSISTELTAETKDDLLAVLFTEKPYDNNYFFESNRTQIIVSLFGWKQLTSLPKNNGAVYFIVALLVRGFGIGESHRLTNTGCINDFWRDKRGVDAGMRSAFLCLQCLSNKSTKQSTLLRPEVVDLKNILDDLSFSSRSNEDICDQWERQSSKERFDVFICHNSSDKTTIRIINKKLKKKGIRTWLDEEQLPPGRPWQNRLENQIESITAVAVFVGPSGIGPWQDAEISAFLTEFVRRDCPVIPVILDECQSVPRLPVLLRQFMWVDFRKTKPSPMESLIWGITGEKPIRGTRRTSTNK